MILVKLIETNYFRRQEKQKLYDVLLTCTPSAQLLKCLIHMGPQLTVQEVQLKIRNLKPHDRLFALMCLSGGVETNQKQ